MAIGIGKGFSSMDLDLISRITRFYGERPQAPYEEVCAAVGLNRPKVEGYNSLLKHFGLALKRELTPLGQVVSRNDEYLRDPGTLCVLHYQLCANQAAEVWHFASNKFLPDHKRFTRDELEQALAEAGIGEGKTHLPSDISLFLHSYTNEESRALRGIGYLRKTGDVYVASPVDDVPALVVGYALYDQRSRGEKTSTMAIDHLLNMNGQVGKAFLLDREQLIRKLRQLEAVGWVTISRIADLDNITFKPADDPLELLEAYYREQGRS